MGYLEIIIIIFIVLGVISGIGLLHFFIFSVIGLFARKTYPQAKEKGKYGIIISARNEEKVIAGLIRSIRENDYPQENIQIFLVAHNCTDQTAKVAREAGAIVYEYNNPEERTLGFAYRALFQAMKEDHFDFHSVDGFLVMNADNTVQKNYLSKMNDAFQANHKECVITSYRNSKNFSENYMSCLYGIFFVAACRYEARGRTLCGVSTRISGTGYLYPAHLVENGWEYVSLTEDWEFSADRIACGTKIYYCDEAEFFDEQPTTVPIMLRQRMRWGKGHMDVFFTRFKKVVSSIFHPHKYGGKKKNLMSKYDIAVEIMPLGVIGVVSWLLQILLLALTPLFGYDAGEVFAKYFLILGIGLASSYLITVLSAILILMVEKKRIGKLKFGSTLLAVLLWPFFVLLNVFLDVAALFVKKLEWKPIPHSYNKKEKVKVKE